MPRLKPLQQFICDTCGQIIEHPTGGMLQWRGFNNACGFTITHKPHTSPRGGRNGCYTIPLRDVADFELQHVALPTPEVLDAKGYSDSFDGLARLTGLLDPRSNGGKPAVADIGEFMEVFRRLYVPYYEEARAYREQAEADGMYQDLWGYQKHTQDFLQRVVRRYGRDDGEEL